MKGLMVLGTASDVGKSIVQTLLCRYFVNQGFLVSPFKSQNMTNHLYKTKTGGLISEAQALQAQAAKVRPTVAMNPIVLSMQSDGKAQVILHGEPSEVVTGQAYREYFYRSGLQAIEVALAELNETYELIFAEGAGSPVEINLKSKELVNMKVAELADIPAVLVADIDRGGVFASVIGTLTLLTEAERRRVKGIIINKFQGDIALFEAGIDWLEKQTGLPVLGVLPKVQHAIPREDSLSEENDGAIGVSHADDVFDDLVKKLQPHLDFKKIHEIIESWG